MTGRRYKLLITRQVLGDLGSQKEKRQETLKKFLQWLISGDWESEYRHGDAELMAWKAEDAAKTLYSMRLWDDLHAVWERVWSVDLLARLRYPLGVYSEDESPPREYTPHIILHPFHRITEPTDEKAMLLGETVAHLESIDEENERFYVKTPFDEVTYNEQLYLLASERVEDVLKGVQQGLPLHMVEEQADVLAFRGPGYREPILMSGEAGSGKTTVITHWLVINHLEKPGVSQLFVTFSKRLRDQARKEFELMLPRGHRSHGTEFLTYRDLLLRLIHQRGLEIRGQGREMTFEGFMREYSEHVSQRLDPVLVWDEIRSVIKGGIIEGTERFLDFEAYQHLSDERGQCKTPPELRLEYYSEAQKYQNHLTREGLWDALDLAFDCLGVTKEAKKYSYIACDEVQDLAPIEISVLVQLIKDGLIKNMFLTGDIAQVINPSGFRWERLKGDLWRLKEGTQIGEPKTLKRNFRSSREIVDLVNSILRVRKDILDDEVSQNLQISYVETGAKPMILTFPPSEVLNSAQSNPDQRLILVKTKEQKANVREILGDSAEQVTILTVEESKGLEWDGALLWNFFIPRHEEISRNDWEAIFVPKRRQALVRHMRGGDGNPYALTYEFNLLHVGLTRARKLLLLYEDDPKRRIEALGKEIEGLIVPADREVFRLHWETLPPTAEQLMEAAYRLLDKDRDQAYHFYRQAARLWQREGENGRAGECYERSQDFDKAASCYEAAGMRAEALAAHAQHATLSLKWREAGVFWKQHAKHLVSQRNRTGASNSFREAMLAFENADDFAGAAECATLHAEMLPEAHSREKAESYDHASRCWHRAKETDEEAKCLQAAIRAGNAAKQQGVSSLGGEHIASWLARRHLGLGELNEAQKPAAAAGQVKEAAGLLHEAISLSTSETEKESLSSRYVGALRTLVGLYEKTGQHQKALSEQKKLLNLLKKGAEISKTEAAWIQLANMHRSAGEFLEYKKQILSLEKHLREKNEEVAALRVLRKCAEECTNAGEWDTATDILQRLADLHSEVGNAQSAAKTYEQIAEAQLKGERSVDAHISLRRAGGLYLEVSLPKKAEAAFGRGLEIVAAEMTPSGAGWYCLKDVVLDHYVANRPTYAPPREAYDWVRQAGKHFSREISRARDRVLGYIRQTDRHGDSLEKDKLGAPKGRKEEIDARIGMENAKKAWAMLALALAHAYASHESKDPGKETERAREFGLRTKRQFEEIDALAVAARSQQLIESALSASGK